MSDGGELHSPAPSAPDASSAGGDRLLVNKQELAQLRGVSVNTIDNWMRRYAEFPVEQVGSNGVPYLFDAAKVDAFLRGELARAEAADKERQAEMAQFRLDLLGGSIADEQQAKLSPRQQLESTLAEIKLTELAKLRRELLPAADVEQILVRFIAAFGRYLERLAEAMELNEARREQLYAERDHMYAGIMAELGLTPLIEQDTRAAA